jgi:hypothetical protein
MPRAPPRFPLARTPRPASAHRSARGGIHLRRTDPSGPLPCRHTSPHRRLQRRRTHVAPPMGYHWLLLLTPPCAHAAIYCGFRARQVVDHFKKPSFPSRARVAYRRLGPPPSTSVLTARSTSGRFSLQTRAAPASLLHQHSSHPRLLATPSRQLAGVITPAAAAAGLRRARPPALSPPCVSTQIAPLWPLDPPQLLPRPRPSARSPESGWPRRPMPLDYIACSEFFPGV